jgi:hypothetical protein
MNRDTISAWCEGRQGGRKSIEETVRIGAQELIRRALVAGATCIVSGDSHLVSLRQWRGIPVVSPADFISRMRH